jgi:hypothetical protein
LRRHPFRYDFTVAETEFVGVAADPGDVVHTNDRESYCPLTAVEFF